MRADVPYLALRQFVLARNRSMLPPRLRTAVSAVLR